MILSTLPNDNIAGKLLQQHISDMGMSNKANKQKNKRK